MEHEHLWSRMSFFVVPGAPDTRSILDALGLSAVEVSEGPQRLALAQTIHGADPSDNLPPRLAHFPVGAFTVIALPPTVWMYTLDPRGPSELARRFGGCHIFSTDDATPIAGPSGAWADLSSVDAVLDAMEALLGVGPVREALRGDLDATATFVTLG
jgi:hypothetical protein